MKRAHAIFLIAAAFCGSFQPKNCAADGTALLLQQTPPQGGTITPDTGIHQFKPKTKVVLTAVPKPGYQFVYWLGDVCDPTANKTMVYLDVPKIVIAVFERASYAFTVIPEGTKSPPLGGSIPSPADYSRQGYTGGGAKRISRPEPPQPPQPPVPKKSDDLPIPSPEPATVMLLAFGGLLTLLRKPSMKSKLQRPCR
jgi:hypothetical protein